MIDIDVLEVQRLDIQRQLDLTKTPDERNKLGQFATPTKLAMDILDYARSLIPLDAKIRFLDPAFGTGSFFSALLRLFSPTQIVEATGFEIDPLYGHKAIEIWKDRPLKLHLADFTSAKPPHTEKEKANLLICNPPYVRHHYLAKAEKQRLQRIGEQSIGIRFSEQTGLYGHFLSIAHRWLAEEGLAGWLIPSEFMDVRYGGQLKEYLLSKVTLLRIHCFAAKDLQFYDALVTSSIVWFKNTSPPDNFEVELTLGGTLAKPEHSQFVNNDKLTSKAKWIRVFSGLNEKPLFGLPTKNTIASNSSDYRREFSEIGGTELVKRQALLSDLFDVKRGLATGANKFFLLDEEAISEHQLSMEFLVPVLPNPRYLKSDKVDADFNGHPLLKRKLFLLNCNLPEDEIKINHPPLWKYLQTGVEIGVDKGYLCRTRKYWYSQEKRSASMFLCAYMGRQNAKKEKPFRFVLNRSIALATNAYHILYPKPFLQEVLKDNPTIADAIWHGLQAITSDTLIGEGRVYGGGMHKMEPKELANVPADGLIMILRNYSIGMPGLLLDGRAESQEVGVGDVEFVARNLSSSGSIDKL